MAKRGKEKRGTERSSDEPSSEEPIRPHFTDPLEPSETKVSVRERWYAFAASGATIRVILIVAAILCFLNFANVFPRAPWLVTRQMLDAKNDPYELLEQMALYGKLIESNKGEEKQELADALPQQVKDEWNDILRINRKYEAVQKLGDHSQWLLLGVCYIILRRVLGRPFSKRLLCLALIIGCLYFAFLSAWQYLHAAELYTGTNQLLEIASEMPQMKAFQFARAAPNSPIWLVQIAEVFFFGVASYWIAKYDS